LCGYGNGFLSDPLIHRIVYGFMTKLFYRLIQSLKELGARVVFANMNKVIINTTHYDLSSAREYIDFILNALARKPIFGYLHVRSLH
jgi:DNA polymerase epsilon subunit 1